MLEQGLGDEQMVVEDAGADATRVYAEVKYVFGDVQPLVGEIFRDTPRLFQDVGAGRQNETRVRATPHPLDEAG